MPQNPQTISITVTRVVELTYDNNSPEFKEALASYREVIDSDADEDKMLQVVAANLVKFYDHDEMIEGVGYVRLAGNEPPEDNWSGITVEPDYDEQHTEIE